MQHTLLYNKYIFYIHGFKNFLITIASIVNKRCLVGNESLFYTFLLYLIYMLEQTMSTMLHIRTSQHMSFRPHRNNFALHCLLKREARNCKSPVNFRFWPLSPHTVWSEVWSWNQRLCRCKEDCKSIWWAYKGVMMAVTASTLPLRCRYTALLQHNSNNT